MLHFFAVAILKIEWFRSRIASTTTRHIRWQMAATTYEVRAGPGGVIADEQANRGHYWHWQSGTMNKKKNATKSEKRATAHPETGSCARHDYYLNFDHSSRYYSLL